MHIFRGNVKFDFVLGDISTRNISLSRGALAIIDWEGSYSSGETDVGFPAHSNKFTKRLASDISHLFPHLSFEESELFPLTKNLLREWRMLNQSGSFCRLLDSSWGVESLLAIFTLASPTPMRPW